jgi:hypothetical protein
MSWVAKTRSVLEKYAPRGFRNQSSPLTRLLDELHRNRPGMAYFPESEKMMMMMMMKCL